MSKKSEERKRKNRKLSEKTTVVLGLLLVVDVIVYITAFNCGNIKLAADAFIAIFFIVPPLALLACTNIDCSSSFPWFVD